MIYGDAFHFCRFAVPTDIPCCLVLKKWN